MKQQIEFRKLFFRHDVIEDRYANLLERQFQNVVAEGYEQLLIWAQKSMIENFNQITATWLVLQIYFRFFRNNIILEPPVISITMLLSVLERYLLYSGVVIFILNICDQIFSTAQRSPLYRAVHSWRFHFTFVCLICSLDSTPCVGCRQHFDFLRPTTIDGNHFSNLPRLAICTVSEINFISIFESLRQMELKVVTIICDQTFGQLQKFKLYVTCCGILRLFATTWTSSLTHKRLICYQRVMNEYQCNVCCRCQILF